MRLIDADALMDDINELKKSPWYNSDINGSRVVRSEVLDIVQRLCIENAPTVDAVEVVRCRDCKDWYAYADKRFGYCRRECWEDDVQYRLEVETAHDDFCSYGEREGE